MTRPLVRLIGLLAVVTMLAAACGGDADPVATDTAASDTDEPAAEPDTETDTETDTATDDAATSDTGSGESEAEPADWPHTFVADQIGGSQLDANDLAGQDVILWFWAPW